MNNNNENASVGVTFKFGNKQGVSAEFGVIESNPNAPYNPNNNLKLYDSKDTYNRIPSVNAIVCYIHCDDFISNHTNNNTKQSTIDSNSIFSNIESTNQNNTNKPFNYKDSHITAKEIINNDNTPTLVIESKTNLLEYQGNTADTLMTGLSAMFASMATLAEKYEVDKTLKEVAKGALGSKGRILSSVLFQTEGASVSLAYNYGNNGNDMLKAGVSVGIELFTGWVAGVVATALIPASAPVLTFVGVSALAAVGIGYFLNTKAGKWVVNGITEYLVKPLIDSIESKLQSFFSLFDSNPSKYELVSNPTLESNDYKSLIELLLHKDSNALDIDTLLHTFPNYLAYPTHATTNSTNSSLALSTPKEALPIHITAQCFNHKNEPLANKEIYVYSPNFYSFVDRARSDENGFIEFNNACVSSKMTNSDLYFVLNRCGLDEEQKDFHTKISPSKTIQPKDKKTKELLEQRLSFEKNIPKAITLNDNIKPNIKVNAIEYIPQEYNHNSFNSPLLLEHHLIESITLQAHYVLKDSHKKNIQGDEQSLLKESIQRYKHKTKWGYIVFDRDEEIEQTLKQVNKTQPLIYSKRFKELENIKGEIVNIPFKEEWENKQIRFFAYLWRAHKDVGIDVHYQATIPDNVIRIETLDESDEFIEIVLPPTLQIDDPPLEDMSAMFIPALRGIGSAIKGVKGVAELSRSLTREEVLEVVGRLPKGLKSNGEINERIYLVKSKKELDELWEKLTKNAKELEAQIDKRHGKPIYRRQLDDGTNINYRVDSKTGGETIDINSRNPKVNVKIHIDKGM